MPVAVSVGQRTRLTARYVTCYNLCIGLMYSALQRLRPRCTDCEQPYLHTHHPNTEMQAQNFHLQIRSKAAAAVHRKTSPLCHVARSTISQQHKQHRPQAASQAVETLQEHDVVALTNADGSVDYCQVLQGCSESQQRCQLLWKGQVLQMTADAQLESLGRSGLRYLYTAAARLSPCVCPTHPHTSTTQVGIQQQTA